MDKILYSLKTLWCAVWGCYECYDYRIPVLTLPEEFVVEETIEGVPSLKGSEWRGGKVVTYFYKARISGGGFVVIDPPFLRNETSFTRSYWLSAYDENGNRIRLALERSEDGNTWRDDDHYEARLFSESDPSFYRIKLKSDDPVIIEVKVKNKIFEKAYCRNILE